ncbi:MAG: cysteine-rich repeat protein [Hyphomicrobiaceae bacterium]|jgi:cysteine-rich repeat protein
MSRIPVSRFTVAALVSGLVLSVVLPANAATTARLARVQARSQNPVAIGFVFEMAGETLEFEMEEFSAAGPGAKAIWREAGGERIEPITSVGFLGQIAGEADSLVSLAAGVAGISGIIRRGDTLLFLEPAGSPDQVTVSTAEELGMGANYSCGVDGESLLAGAATNDLATNNPATNDPATNDPATNDPATHGANPTGGPRTPAIARLLQSDVLADPQLFAVHGGGTQVYIEAMYTVAAGLFRNDLGLKLEIDSLVIETVTDPFAGETEINTLLGDFSVLHTSTQNALPASERLIGVGTHITAREFDGSEIGLAFVGSVCAGSSVSTVQATFGAAGDAITLSHEIGHNLSSNHDGVGNVCDPSSFVMSATTNFVALPTEFSTCSKDAIAAFTGGQNVVCMPNTGFAVCGDGIVEEDEECDDGLVEEFDGCSSQCKNEVNPTKGEAKCLNALTKGVSKIAAAQGKLAAICIKFLGKDPAVDVDACIDLDERGKVAKTTAKLVKIAGKSCVELPPFGANDPSPGDTAAVLAAQALVRDVFSEVVDSAVVDKAVDSDGARCQLKVFKAATKLASAFDKILVLCVKAGFKIGSLVSDPTLADCLDIVAEDLSGKLGKASAKFAKIVTKSCEGADMSLLFPGDCAAAGVFADCVDSLVACRSCQVWNDEHGVDEDCDLFDDSVENFSCEDSALPPPTQTVFHIAAPIVPGSTGPASFASMAEADALCQQAASDAGLENSASFLAWMSDAGGATPLTRFTQALVPYVLVDGTVIANHFFDLIDETLEAPIDRDEFGVQAGANRFAWTGTTADGEGVVGTTCDDWALTTGSARVGRTDGTNVVWSGLFTSQCGVTATADTLFCFEQ